MRKSLIFIVIFLLSVSIVLGVIAWQRYIIKQPVEEKKIYKVGLLQMASVVSQNMDGFRMGMEELGYKEGDNIIYIYRDAQGDLEKLKQYGEELIGLNPDMVFTNTSPSALVMKELTKDNKTPVVFSMVADPVGAGFVASAQSSGNNLTGTSCAYVDIAPKRIEMLQKVAPSVKKVLIPYRPEDKSAGPCTERIINKGKELGLEIIAKKISKKEDVEEMLKNLQPGEVDAVMDPGDSMVSSVTEIIVKYSKQLKIPYMALSKGEVEKGALTGYAVDYVDLGKQTSLIANQVLAGINPQDIPFEQPRLWYFAINLDTASEIGLQISDAVMEEANCLVKGGKCVGGK